MLIPRRNVPDETRNMHVMPAISRGIFVARRDYLLSLQPVAGKVVVGIGTQWGFKRRHVRIYRRA
jgi:hypothetical protein